MALHAKGVFSFAESTEGDVAFLSTPSNPRNHPAPRQRETFYRHPPGLPETVVFN